MHNEGVQEFRNKADDLFHAGGNESAENEHQFAINDNGVSRMSNTGVLLVPWCSVSLRSEARTRLTCFEGVFLISSSDIIPSETNMARSHP